METRGRSRGTLWVYLLAVCLLITGAKCLQDHTSRHRTAEDATSLHIANIESDLEYAASQVYALRSLIVGAEGDIVNLQRMGSILRREDVDRFISGVLLAPDGYVSQVFPREGNEYMLGVNLLGSTGQDPQSLFQAQKTSEGILYRDYVTETGEPVIAIQLPVFVPRENDVYDFWGVVAVSVALPKLLENLRTDVLTQRDYVYRVVQTGADGTETELVNCGVTDQSHLEVRSFRLAKQELCIEAAPGGGWENAGSVVIFFLQVLLVGAGFGVVSELLLRKLHLLMVGASTDSLTGLMNRAAGTREIEGILRAKSFRNGAFLILDIDNFKQVNDRLGHRRGDEVLKNCARQFCQLFRQRDVLLRLGGDEFVIFLPYAGDDSFLRGKVEKLLRLMCRAVMDEEHVVNISASVGVAIAPQQGTTFEMLYQNADAALYRAKAMGRNCAVFYEDSQVVSGGSRPRPVSIADRKTILIVDDDFMNREIIKNIFSGHFRFAEAGDGREGLLKEAELENDLCAILLDVKMPVMDGMEMLRDLYERGVPSYIPVFMITAHDEEDITTEAYHMGVVDVVSKPIMPEVIRRRVQTVIELYQARAMLKQELLQKTQKEVSEE